LFSFWRENSNISEKNEFRAKNWVKAQRIFFSFGVKIQIFKKK